MARENNTSVFSIIAEIYSGKLTGELIPRAIKSIKAFFELLEGIFDISDQLDITDLINFILERTDYISYIRRDEDKGLDREENINELKASSDQYTGIDTGSQLSSFLENVALVSNVDNLEGGDDVRPSSEDLTLITLHQAKGLEYDAVFLVGCEEGLLPHVMSIGEPDSLEEERRICYVGITRAKNNLYFSYSLVRRFRGVTGGQMLSRFVNEIPENLTTKKYARGFSHPLIDGYLKNSPNRKFKSPNTRPLVDEKRTVQFSKGTKVKHDIFGDGIIIKNEGNEGEVVFLKHGVKRLMWQYAPMIVIEKKRRHENDSHDFVDPEIDTA
jgi:DNA helicase-2/ATP-dependent DNA helicase PcrA